MNKPFFALTGIMLIVFVAFFEYTVVTTAAPTIQTEFNVPILDLQWILNIYSIVMVSTAILWGRLADLYGRRIMFYTGAIILLLGSIGAGLATGFWELIFFRGIQALGVASTVTIGPSLILTLYKENPQRPMSLYGTLNGIGLTIGPTVGGLIVMHLGWRYIFLINIPLITIALLCCFPSLPESKANEKPSLDAKGAILLILTLISIIYGLIRGASLGWLNPGTIALAVVFMVCLPLLIRVEGQQDHPIMNFHFFRKPIFLLASIGCAANGAFVAIAMFFSPIFLQRIMHETPKQAGIFLLAIPIAVIFFSPFVGKLTQKIGIKTALIIIPAISLISSMLYLSFSAHSSTLLILSTFLIIGIAWSITIVSAPIAASSTANASQSSIAIGTVLSVWNIAAAIATAIGSIIFDNIYLANEYSSKDAYIAGFNALFVFMTVLIALLMVIATIVLFSNKNRKTKTL